MTKFVKNGIPKQFITDNDILITNINHSGQTLDKVVDDVEDTLEEHDEEIKKLKSNLKYIYSYGGVGGRGSGGSGGGTAGNPSLFVSVGGHQLQNNGNPIVFREPGTYTLEISISNSGGETFYVTVGAGNMIEYPTEYKLSIDLNKCRRSDNILLSNNGEIVVNFYDADYSPLSTIRQQYIVNPHTFEMKFKYEYDNGSGTKQEGEFDSNNEYFIGDTVYTNPFIDASFKIDIPNVTNISIQYSIGDTENGQGTETFEATDITGNHFKIYLDQLIRDGKQFTDESNTGTYTVSMTLNYYSNAELVTDPLSFKITLIPNYLYIYVRNPQDLMYDTLEDLIQDREDQVGGIPSKSLNLGTYTSFYCKVYEGPIKTARLPYTVYLKSYDCIDEDEFIFDEEHPSNDEYQPGVYEQVEMTPPFSITFGTPGIKKLVFSTIGRKDDIPDREGKFVKYIYVLETAGSVDWHPETIQHDNFYFKANMGDSTYSEHFPVLSSNKSPFELSETSSPVTLTDSAWTPSSNDYDTTILSIGIQYSMVNNDGAEILRTYTTSSQNADIILYSNKLFSDKKICIPTESNFNKSINEQYHLVQIVRYRVGTNNNNKPQYATYLYIDGKLESNDPIIRDNQLYINRIVLNNVNIVYNLINLQYVRVTQPDIPNPPYTMDGLIYQYYLAYKEKMHVGVVSEAEKSVYKSLSNIRFDGVNTIVSYSLVQTIAPYMPVPTMMMEYTGTDYSTFINNLFKGYPNGDDSFNQRPISLYWCDGEKPGVTTSLEKITIPKITNEGVSYDGTWMVELQGTSTMRNRIKNFSLVLNTQNTTGDKVLLMSPNYKANDPTTFLPERVWTLKADIADSAHANNTAVGKFVNRTCTSFSLNNGVNIDANLKNYIKNTLEGFPVLMYFKIGEEVYYLGVYNFNMGRQSYYNLGYHTSADMTDMVRNITTSGPFTYSVGSGEVINTLAIGEIQDNFAQFDFHQYQENVLFTGNNDDGRSTMFGADSKITGANVGAAKTTLMNFVKSVTRAGAYCFANIGKTPVPSSEGVDEHGNRYGNCVNRYDVVNGEECVPDPSWQFSYNGTTRVWEQKTDAAGGITFDGVKNNVENLLQCIYPTDSENNPHPYFLDFASVSEYYTICMAFGLVDSILKNMNIKSWDGKKCFIAFYDMDCALGENNAGGEDVSYLAATDFWHSNTDRGYVEPVTINYDYWDDTIGKGFDFSSSYLFAIAKYAKAILGSSYTLSNYPQQFWAKLRQPKNDENDELSGQLCSADYFINKYFSSGIGKVPSYLASLNYQVKYLYKGTILDDEGRETEVRFLANSSAFNGTRLEKVKEWLNKRLHFLDVMFNVQGIGVAIGGGYTTPKADKTLLDSLSGNADIVVLTDAFSTPNAKSILMGSNGVPVDVYAPMNTPFIINRGGSNEIYLLCAGTDEPNPIRITSTRSESYRFLGSKEFTDVSIIEPFLTSAQQIVSNKLEKITYGGRDVPSYDVDFHIVSTSVKIIKLDIPTLNGSLNIDNSGLNGKAVHTLDISKSGLVGSFANLDNLRTLNISSVNSSNGEIIVSGCPLVGDLCTISGVSDRKTTLKTLRLLGVSGNFNISNTHIQDIELEVAKDKDGTISISGDTLLRKLTLSGFREIVIRGCPNLNELTITDTDNVCEKIIIEIPEYTPAEYETRDYLWKFNSSRNGVYDFTTYTNLKTLGVSGCDKLEVIKIPDCKVSIDTFKNNKNLEFVDTTGEHSIIELTKDSTFYNCPRYNMRQSWWSVDGENNGVNITTLTSGENKGNSTKMCISEGCTSLAHTFDKLDSTIHTNYKQSSSETGKTAYVNTWGQKVLNPDISNADAIYFINLCTCGHMMVGDVWSVMKHDSEWLDEDNIIHDASGQDDGIPIPDRSANIISLQGCFNRQKGIDYNGENSKTLPSLLTFTGLTDISLMYYGTDVKYLSAKLLSLPPELNNNESDAIQWRDFIGSGPINILKDAFKNISYRIVDFSNIQLTIFKDGTSSGRRNPINTNLDTDGYLDIVSILWPRQEGHETEEAQEYNPLLTYVPFERLDAFYTFYVDSRQYVDYTKLMDICPNMKILSGFLNCDLSKSKIDGMLKNCKNLTSISESFNHTNSMDIAPEIDLYDFFNWGDEEHPEDSLFDMDNLFESINTTVPGFSINKTISQANFKKIMDLLPNYTKITKISNLFSYCTITDYSENYEIKLGGSEDEPMSKIKNINSLFYKCKYANNTPLNIRRSFFKKLPNVISMANTFYEVNFDHMFSYDFFCKREYISEGVYVKIGDEYKNATLHTINYNASPINDMYKCFYGAKFKNCRSWFDEADGNIELRPETDYITYNGVDNYTTTYYKYEGGLPVEYHITDPVAYTDTLNNFTHYINEFKSSFKDWIINNHNLFKDLSTFGNYQMAGYPYTTNAYDIYPTYCCLPPDILHYCTKDCNLLNVFSNTNIIGVLPQHLLMNCYNSKLNNMLENVNILPNLLYHYDSRNESDAGYLSLIQYIDIDETTITTASDTDTVIYELGSGDATVLFRNANGELRRRRPIVGVHKIEDGEVVPVDPTLYKDYNKSQFVYVPQGYTMNTNLQEAFTFRYNLPPQVDLQESILADEGIVWPNGATTYDITYSPENRPDLWPYHIQYFLTTNESISWKRLYNMSSPFISDEQDVDFSDGTPRVFSTDERTYSNLWWYNNYSSIIYSDWNLQTNNDAGTGNIFNVFFDLCGMRNVRTGKVTDFGCVISEALNNYPTLSSFVSGIMVIFLNGKVFDDAVDGGRLSSINGTNIIQYNYGFGKNIIFPIVNYKTTNHPRVLLSYPSSSNYIMYEFMFADSASKNNYIAIYGGNSFENKINTTVKRYFVRSSS